MTTKPNCTVPQCDREVVSLSNPYCRPHWQRVLATGDVRADVPIRKRRPGKAPDTCAVTGCGRPHCACSYCAAHLYRYHRFGDPLGHIAIGDRAAVRRVKPA